MALLLSALPLRAAPRNWTTPQGALVAEYMNSTVDTVTLRAANGQALRLKLSDLAEADRTFVAEKQAESKKASLIEARIRGEIVWRIPLIWNSLGVSSGQPVEIWLWDDKTRKPTVKVAETTADYKINTSTRNQFEGTFVTKEPVSIAKDARVVVKARFKSSVNRKDKVLDEISVPATLPTVNKGEIKLPTIRLSVSKASTD
jgi:hypothetical protein